MHVRRGAREVKRFSDKSERSRNPVRGKNHRLLTGHPQPGNTDNAVPRSRRKSALLGAAHDNSL